MEDGKILELYWSRDEQASPRPGLPTACRC